MNTINQLMRSARTHAAPTLLAAVMAAGALTAVAQTRIVPDRNKYTPQQDVELGRQAAAEVRRELPLLDDHRVDNFVEAIGERLVDHIHPELRQPAFRSSFDVVNLKEINAFALPGGPMFVNRGMLEAAGSEAEVAGVMAHELSHVVLRHGTAQATKGEKFQIGAIAGQVLGAIVGGRAGSVIAQGSQFGLGAYFLKYGREYEREADLLGAQIMARAGYDPRAMASMFRTIERQGGSRAPEWLSDHPNPGNRYDAINREAAMLTVQGSAGSPAEFGAMQARLRELPPALTTEQVARGRAEGRRPVGTGGRRARIEPPSDQWRTYQPGDFLRVNVPANWEQVAGGTTVTYAPDGAYVRHDGQTAFTHGVEVGVMPNQSTVSLQQATDRLLGGFAQSNPDLRRQAGYRRADVGGRSGLNTVLANVSEISGDPEVVDVSTVQLRDGSVLFLIGVAPEAEAGTYRSTFSRVRQALQIADRR